MQKNGSLHLTKKTEYGLFLLATLAKNKKDDQSSMNTISRENHIPLPFLQKIANSLQKNNLIKAERGKYGGYSLAKPAKKITIREIVETLEGEIAIAPCMKKTAKKCKRANCCIKKCLESINEDIKSHFLSKTVDQIISY